MRRARSIGRAQPGTSRRSVHPAASRSRTELTTESYRHEAIHTCAGIGGTAAAAWSGERRLLLQAPRAAAPRGCAGEAPSCPLRRVGDEGPWPRRESAGLIRAIGRFCSPALGSPRPVAAGRSPVAQRGRSGDSPPPQRPVTATQPPAPPARQGGCIVVLALGHLGGGRGPSRRHGRDLPQPGRAGSGTRLGPAVRSPRARPAAGAA